MNGKYRGGQVDNPRNSRLEQPVAGETSGGAQGLSAPVCWLLSSSWSSSAVATKPVPAAGEKTGEVLVSCEPVLVNPTNQLSHRLVQKKFRNYQQDVTILWFVILNSEKCHFGNHLYSHFLTFFAPSKTRYPVWFDKLCCTFALSLDWEKWKDLVYLNQWTVMFSKTAFMFIFLTSSSGSKSPTPDDLMPELKVSLTPALLTSSIMLSLDKPVKDLFINHNNIDSTFRLLESKSNPGARWISSFDHHNAAHWRWPGPWVFWGSCWWMVRVMMWRCNWWKRVMRRKMTNK